MQNVWFGSYYPILWHVLSWLSKLFIICLNPVLQLCLGPYIAPHCFPPTHTPLHHMNGTSVASSCIAGCCLSEEETELGHTTNILVRSQLCWIYEVWSIRIINNQQMWIYSGQHHQIGWCCTQTMYYSQSTHSPSTHPSIQLFIRPTSSRPKEIVLIYLQLTEKHKKGRRQVWVVGG